MTQPTVLIVEDNQSLRQSLMMIFEMEGIHTLAAEDGHDAVAVLRKCSPTVVLLDMQLPGSVSGLDLLAAIRRNPRLAATRVVLHTAESHASSLPEAETADLVVVKPADIDDLLTMIRRLF
jgi:CheY-like chemotaxis protein